MTDPISGFIIGALAILGIIVVLAPFTFLGGKIAEKAGAKSAESNSLWAYIIGVLLLALALGLVFGYE